MQINTIDTRTIYRDLLAADDADTRDRLYRERLAGPFDGLLNLFGAGADPVQQMANWGLFTPEEIGDGARERVAAIVHQLAAADAWTHAEAAAADVIAAFAPYADRIPLETVQLGLFAADSSRMLPNDLDKGYTGFGGLPGYVMAIYSAPDDYNLARIKGLVAHELHHNVRFALFPFIPHQVTVAEYMLAEGLAESFATERYGDDLVSYVVHEFDRSRLAEAKRIMMAGLDATGFDTIRAHIFGDRIATQNGLAPQGLPDYAGYALGYFIVQAWKVRTGKSVVDATFLPATQIINESGYFGV